MPAVRPLVDLEALTVAYLAADPSLSDLGAGAATEIPAAFPSDGRAFVQVFRATATTVDPGTGHVERAVLQVNGYGSSKAQAWDVIAETYRALLGMAEVDHPGAVVSSVVRITGPTWSPDPFTDAPRYTSSYAVTVHPTPPR